MKQMKKILSNILAFFAELGKIRAAGIAARLGDHELAKRIMSK